MLYKIVRFFFFLFSPETAHKMAFFGFRLLQNIPFVLKMVYRYNHRYDKAITVFGLEFPNRVGVAAGLDKDAEAFDALGAMGFGHIEIGTVTPKGQPGNPKPRLFRLKKDNALINRMGFNNNGVAVAVKRLKKRKTPIIICGNIGKNKVTPNEKAVDDYVSNFEALYDYVDYFTVNVSSPNTPNLRELQDKEPLMNLLATLQEINNAKPQRKPILLKIAPDLSFEQIDDIIDIVTQLKIDGLVASNTTIERSGLKTDASIVEALGNGGLSGKPLKNRSTEIIRYISEKTNGQLPIIGVGGVFSPTDALEKINAGASLVQVFTGFIYEGPQLIRAINKAFSQL
jgi:dihydroorotate dehydrogenase